MHLFDQFGERALGLRGSAFSDFMPKYLVHELSTRQIRHGQGRSRSPIMYSLAKHLGLLTRIGTRSTTPNGLGRTKEGPL
jgi:hypothetical protein